ncbi:Gfo/Idh/MocA family protein [Aureliella helgolandensis]|uniref:Inositol 2-dehydrogenase n=1 Tax=Aureliella helgolandensis TaxID=2527968 RepID=A0A518G7M7_9BACT|nr:Gfo/Idh/MocA family oxidoreductase [Aureliella helgolandensis]QDV24590.1 Inositol 2-dehydrogenase [Aureliella helgolandensis]
MTDPASQSCSSGTKKLSAIQRRTFVATSASVLAAGVFSSRSVAQSKSANEKLNLACVGTANRADADIQGVKHEQIVALCDVDRNFLSAKSKVFPDAATFEDYREMIDKEGDRIDAVVIGTTDHHHAPATMHAIKAGKHVYCEKPLTHTVAEARMIAEAAKAAGVATQLGTQIHAENNYRRVVEIVQAGALGTVTDVHVWVGKGWGGGDRPEKGDPVPESLNWDLWLGPAPVRPYANGRYHPAQWRRWWDFGQGTLGDMGCHYMDLPFWALKLRHPSHVEAEGPAVHPETAPEGLTVRYKFPKTDVAPAINMTWYDGTSTPNRVMGQRVPNSGVMFVGTDGMMFADYGSYKLFPAEKFADFQPPAKSIPDSIGHHREWLKACRDGSPTTCNFDYSGALTETVLLGNVAFRSEAGFGWNGKDLKADTDAAQKLISKSYRAGWELT